MCTACRPCSCADIPCVRLAALCRCQRLHAHAIAAWYASLRISGKPKGFRR